MSYTPSRLAEEEALPAERRKRTRTKKKRTKRPRRRWPIFAALAAVLLLLAAALYAAVYRGAVLDVDPGILPDINAKDGVLRSTEPDSPVEPGTYRIVLNQQPVAAAGERQCNLELENVSANHYAVQVAMTLTETGETLYASHRVEPGKYIETAALSRTFEPGEYPCAVQYRLFEGGEVVGEIPVNITLVVRAGE